MSARKGLKALKDYVERHCILFLIIALFAIFKVLFLFKTKEIFWDSSVYVGMAKYLYSFGNIGLFESIRPEVFCSK